MFPEIQRLREDGWTFDYSKETNYVTASHPRGGKKSVCELIARISHNGGLWEEQRHEIGEAIAQMLNQPRN